MKKIRLATRGSDLAMAQAKMVADYLSAKNPDWQFEIIPIKTSGDKRQDWSLEKFGGKGLFTKEIEDALLANEADIAVHSAKDLPTDIPAGLSIAGCLPREACADVFVKRDTEQAPAVIASSSPRRRAQLKKIFPHAVWKEIRGNVRTRLKKIVDGEADATVLSQAGLVRLGIESFEGLKFSPLKLDICVPASGQGFIAIECRTTDLETYAPLTDKTSNEYFELERHFLISLGGGCQTAFAANYDGSVFRFFHENCGTQKVKFPEGSSQAQKLEIVKALASPMV